jgi:HNH endonuclease
MIGRTGDAPQLRAARPDHPTTQTRCRPMAARKSTRTRPEHAAFMKAYWTPERRQAHSQAIRAVWKDPAYRRKETVRRKAVWQNPEYRSANIERSKAYWKTRKNRWKAGAINCNGYRRIRIGPYAFLAEHRLIAMRVLGRPLERDEVVHHINSRADDNRPENLLICSASYHSWLERRMEWRRDPENARRQVAKAGRACAGVPKRKRASSTFASHLTP